MIAPGTAVDRPEYENSAGSGLKNWQEVLVLSAEPAEGRNIHDDQESRCVGATQNQRNRIILFTGVPLFGTSSKRAIDSGQSCDLPALQNPAF